MTAYAVVNPKSGGGRTGKHVIAIERALSEALGKVTVALTTAQGDGTRLTREALTTGHRHIIAVGGDGTLNEVVNGLTDADARVAPDIRFSFAMSGSGGDFRRTFGIEGDVLAQIARLRNAAPRQIDLGVVEALDSTGAQTRRLFLNIASFGMSGDIVDRVNRARIAKWFGGPFAFKWHSIMGALAFRPYRVRWSTEGGQENTTDLSTLAVCNGRYFGGGMMIAPNADPQDGLFDVVAIAEAQRGAMIGRLNDIYAGKHIEHPNVSVTRATRVQAVPEQAAPVFIECDGEGGLRLPATFRVLPAELTLVI